LETANTYTVSTSFKADWLSTYRARLGWTLSPNLLAYATGGLALTVLEVTNSFSDNVGLGATGGSTGSQLWAGWTAGGGLEWAMNSAWSVKAEYLYLKFAAPAPTPASSSDPGPRGLFTTISTTGDLTAHVARVGLNYNSDRTERSAPAQARLRHGHGPSPFEARAKSASASG